MPTKTRTTSMTVTDSEYLSRREAAFFADISLRSVDKAIEEKVIKPQRLDALGTVLDGDDVLALAVIAKTGLQLQPKTKKQIRSWVHNARRHAPQEAQELSITDVLWIRFDNSSRAMARELDHYLKGRARYIDSNPAVHGGEPVIAGTRLPVRTVAERLSRGDSIDDLVEDYPGVPKTAFEAARIYAQSHPRRG